MSRRRLVQSIRCAAEARAPRLPGTFWWLCAWSLVGALATLVFPFLALFLTGRGFSVARAGLLASLFGAGSIVAAPAAGWLADRAGRRPSLLVALVGTAGLTALLAAARAPLSVAALSLALGVVANASRPVCNAIVADLVAPAERVRAYGLLYWGHNVGLAFSFAVGGAFAHRGYGALFLADAATTLLFAALVAWKVPETRPALRTAGDGPGDALPSPLSNRPLLALLLLNLLFLLVFCQHQVALPVAMARQGLSPAQFGRVMAVNGVLVVALQPLATPIAARFDRGNVLAAASLVVGLGYGAYALCRTPLHYAAATATWTLGEILAFPVASGLLADISPPSQRGRYQGLLGLSVGAGMTLAPSLGGVVMEGLGACALWRGCLLLAALVAAGHLAAGRARRRASGPSAGAR